MVGVVAGAYGGATLGERFGAWLDTVPGLAGYGRAIGVTTVLVAITYLSIVLGELIPKRIALRNPERVASLVARPMRTLSRIVAPMVWLLGASTDVALRLLGLHGEREATVTEEEVRSMITEGTQAGVFVPEEKAMIDGVLRLADRAVRVIMTQRPDVIWFDRNADRATIAQTVEATPHGHFLVCDGTIDRAIGLVSTRDLLRVAIKGGEIDLNKIVQKTLFVPDQTPVLKLIELFRRQGVRAAIVVDEYGATEGIVTSTDVLEGIAGSLPNRGDREEAQVVRRPDGSWLVDGMMPIDEFEDVCGLPGLRDAGDFETVAGFLINRLGHLPKAGEHITYGDVQFEVVDMDGRRIDKVLVTNTKPEYEG
jgi:putative hemolysin